MSSEREENNRQYEVVDQLLSIHSSLRDRYQRRALLLKLGLLTASILLCAFVFADEAIVRLLGVTSEMGRFLVGFASIGVFILSMMELLANWTAAGQRHADAVVALTELKSKYRAVYAQREKTTPGRLDRLGREYGRVTRVVPPVPERLFNRLKSKHRFKRSLSRCISAHPDAPWWILWTKLRWRGLYSAFGSQCPGENEGNARHQSDS
jgi:hypothetical protein